MTTVTNLHGRIASMRLMGKSCFMNIMSQGIKYQLYAKPQELENFDTFISLKVGDLITINEGTWFVTHSGENTIRVQKYTLEQSVIVSMPFPKTTDEQVFHEITDKELRYRQRYIDLQVNPDVFQLFVKRTRMIEKIQSFFQHKNFLHVETPILQSVYGGASAQPFVTHYNALNQDMFLRIAPELYLKRLLVGGFERIYEIGKNFRNEGLDKTHNPEFTMLEAYEAYSDYTGMMDLVRDLFVELTSYTDWIPTYQYTKLVPFHIALADKDTYFKEHVQYTLQEPCFVIDYPRVLVPLAKAHRTTPELAEKFQFYWKGIELANGYTEQNDYNEQRRMFENQVNTDYPLDEGFLEALKYGMPPAGGVGIGLDRLFMTLHDIESIKEIILFPHMRTI